MLCTVVYSSWSCSWNCYKPYVLLTFDKVHNRMRLPRKTAAERQKVVRTHQFFTLLTWKCVPPQQHAFFDIWTLNVKKWSEPVSFLHFWLRNMLRATTACNFSSLIWPRGSAPAALASLLVDLPEPQIIGKTQWIETNFSRTCIFFLLTLSLLWPSFFFSSPLWLFPPKKNWNHNPYSYNSCLGSTIIFGKLFTIEPPDTNRHLTLCKNGPWKCPSKECNSKFRVLHHPHERKGSTRPTRCMADPFKLS